MAAELMGEVINGGFGMVLTDRKKHQNESNPCFSGMSTTEFQEEVACNDGAIFAIKRAMEAQPY
jgi:hypothetical protein